LIGGGYHVFSRTPDGGWIDLTWAGAKCVSDPVEHPHVNDRGQVTATCDNHAFVWMVSGGPIDLGTFGGVSSHAIALNGSGHVVGMSQTPDSSLHAFFWTPENGTIDLGTLGGRNSYAFGLNDRDQVVGSADTNDGRSHAFRWTPTDGMVD